MKAGVVMVDKKKFKNHLPFRLNMLFFLIFICFSVLVLRLGLLQIVQGETYKREVEQKENVTSSNAVPRGKILDRNYNVMVDNDPINAITYTRLDGVSADERFEIATRLAKIIEKDTSKVTERDKKDYWIQQNEELAKAKITEADKKKFKEEETSEDDQYAVLLSRITEEDLATITDAELEVLAIKREMESGYKGTPQIIKSEGVSDREYAIVSEHLQDLPGVDVTTDWKRSYPYEDSFRSVLGSITTSDEGLPKDQLPYYEARDYSRNDRVGKSYIEAQYEDILNGKKEKVKNIVDDDGYVIGTEVVSEGRPGQDVVLTIDMELQSRIDTILEEELRSAKGRIGNDLLDRAFFVMLDPKTGEILSMNGKQIEKGENGKLEFVDFGIGAMTTAYPVGSSVKGATILTGFETGALSPGTVIWDAPMQFKGTPLKASWKNLGSIDDLTALQRSSNVYMFHIALKLLGKDYTSGMSLPYNDAAFDTMRYYFNQFGLGVSTGIDLPNESVGYIGSDTSPGFLLDYAIGQYDSFTTLQLAQYVATIANNGYRMKAQILKEVREPVYGNDEELERTVEITHPEVLNKVDIKSEYMERVQEGFRRVMQVQNGTGYIQFHDSSHSPAGKTGTAEAYYEGQSVYNVTMVGYAPFENPEIAFAVVVPHTRNDKDVINKIIGRRAMDAYFDLQKERKEQQLTSNAE